MPGRSEKREYNFLRREKRSIDEKISQRPNQQEVIDYLQEENRVLHEQLGGRRLRLNDDQRRRLAVRLKKLGKRVLYELATIDTPETL